jgi:predicted nucleic acid-binding Zn ribbon protein
MPTYVYKFVDTGETIEIQQSFDEDTLTEAVHPATGKTMAVKKVFLPVGITFKGDGFYKTDSRAKKTPSKSTSKESKEASTSSSSSNESGSSSSSSDSGSSSTSSSGSSSSGSSSSD